MSLYVQDKVFGTLLTEIFPFLHFRAKPIVLISLLLAIFFTNNVAVIKYLDFFSFVEKSKTIKIVVRSEMCMYVYTHILFRFCVCVCVYTDIQTHPLLH